MNNFETRYKELNKEQKKAVDSLDGPVLVVAGPGSGKTEIISLRIANLIDKNLAKPDEILCLTFTDSASQNMLDRLIKIIGSTAYKVNIFTFHAFCTEIISKYSEYFFDTHRFEPISELKQNEILENIFIKIKYGNKLFGYHSERGFSYFKDVKERIKNFKEAGLNPKQVLEKLENNEKDLKKLNYILEKVPEDLRSKSSKERFKELQFEFLKSNTELGKYFGEFLEKEIENNNLSKAKAKLFEKNENNELKFKEERYIEKLKSLVNIYKEYQNELWKQGYFDFNDMIIYVKDKLINNNTLRAEIEETYQYILVDEFQDTNLAQLSLIESITKNEVLEKRPEIFVVGDDDQSVYKFQGAELNNIFHFKNSYKDVKTIVLTDNYRSTQKVLDFAKKIIEKANERLTKIDKNLIKDLTSKNNKLKEGDVYLNSFDEKEKEYLFIAKEINNLIEKGVDPNEIVVISRKHDNIQELLPYLEAKNVAFNYERKESVFDQIHIESLIKICNLLECISENKEEDRDALLSEILSYEFLDIDKILIWEVSVKAYKEKKSWLDIMLKSDNKKIKDFAEFIIELSVLSKTTSLEIILDILIGSKDIEILENEYDDNYENNKENSILKMKSNFVSNYKEFYFGKNVMEKNLASYIHFLSSLRVFIYALREFKKGEKLLVSDLKDFIKLHKDYDVALLNKTNFIGDKKAISLMTVHKSKGLEFEYVFLLASNENIWKNRKENNKIPLPMNMPYSRKSDNEDDFIRLFFVGLTRAKHTIYITHSDNIVPFLIEIKEENLLKSSDIKIENIDLKNGLKIYNIPPFSKNEKALLENLLENYKLSPTHLNNFLDITKGGPKLFLEQNLLRFPKSKTLSSIYGSSIHKTLEHIYKNIAFLKIKDENKILKEIQKVFEEEIKKERLLQKDEEDLIKKGIDKLNNFYKIKKEEIHLNAKNSKVEVDFKNEGVVLNNAELTGKIDNILFLEDDYVEVIDFKTGKELKDFSYKKSKEGEDYVNIKKHNYKQQLMFYKILIENSKRYKNKEVKQGKICFVDDDKISEIIIDFKKDISKEEWNDFIKLIINTFKMIKNIIILQKIDLSKYQNNINGILSFENDIINNNL